MNTRNLKNISGVKRYLVASVSIVISICLVVIFVYKSKTEYRNISDAIVSTALNNFDNGKRDSAIQTLEWMRVLEPKNQIILERLALMYFQTGKYKNFAALISSSEQNSAKILSLKALSDKLKGDPEGAIAMYTEAVKKSPKNDTLYINMAAVYQESGKFDKALEILEQGILIQKNSSRLYTAAAALTHKAGDDIKAKEYANSAIKLNENSPQAKEILSLVN